MLSRHIPRPVAVVRELLAVVRELRARPVVRAWCFVNHYPRTRAGPWPVPLNLATGPVNLARARWLGGHGARTVVAGSLGGP